ncbi:hypothetical protein DK28_0203420 [Peptococcaceae bacterium SCADC1_2_3]|jgi:hypothetical protein|nr:hypothetical protein DK28_0203420 [Peptococcaceae bacterium SCADC1_2_3]KFI35845.1 hypothetical protein HY00_00835 [Peptococcaceae bacterium SCADC1_2_3]HCJ79859.1 hypothetical protein [Desulfotomaculum sp.]
MYRPGKLVMFLVFFLSLSLLVFAGLRIVGLLPFIDSTPQGEQEKLSAKKGNGEEIPREKTKETSRETPANTPEGFAGTPPETTAGKSFSSRQEIEAHFTTKLMIICRYYEGRLNSLLGSTWNEYHTAQKQGQKVSVVSLAKKYIAAGSALERECDQEFYAVLTDFKAELRKNSFPLDKALEAQSEYEKTKAARKKQIFHTAAKNILPHKF